MSCPAGQSPLSLIASVFWCPVQVFDPWGLWFPDKVGSGFEERHPLKNLENEVGTPNIWHSKETLSYTHFPGA